MEFLYALLVTFHWERMQSALPYIPEYASLPASASNYCLSVVAESWSSFFASLSTYLYERLVANKKYKKIGSEPSLPNYTRSRCSTTSFQKEAFVSKGASNHFIKTLERARRNGTPVGEFTISLRQYNMERTLIDGSKLEKHSLNRKLKIDSISFKTRLHPKNVKQVKIVPKRGSFDIVLIRNPIPKKFKNSPVIYKNRAFAIDLGVKNFLTIVSNFGMRPILVKGEVLTRSALRMAVMTDFIKSLNDITANEFAEMLGARYLAGDSRKVRIINAYLKNIYSQRAITSSVPSEIVKYMLKKYRFTQTAFCNRKLVNRNDRVLSSSKRFASSIMAFVRQLSFPYHALKALKMFKIVGNDVSTLDFYKDFVKKFCPEYLLSKDYKKNLEPIDLGEATRKIAKHYNVNLKDFQACIDLSYFIFSNNFENKFLQKYNQRTRSLLHEYASFVVKLALSKGVSTIYIGYKPKWKSGSSLGRRVNRRFQAIPYARFIILLSEKASLCNIKVQLTREWYTSMASAASLDPISKSKSYKGARSVQFFGVFSRKSKKFKVFVEKLKKLTARFESKGVKFALPNWLLDPSSKEYRKLQSKLNSLETLADHSIKRSASKARKVFLSCIPELEECFENYNFSEESKTKLLDFLIEHLFPVYTAHGLYAMRLSLRTGRNKVLLFTVNADVNAAYNIGRLGSGTNFGLTHFSRAKDPIRYLKERFSSPQSFKHADVIHFLNKFNSHYRPLEPCLALA